MLKYFAFIFSVILISCTQKSAKNMDSEKQNSTASIINLYSKSVNDSFSIFTSLPADYNPHQKYPVIYILDANLYFDVYSTILKKYSEVGLLPSAILIGIGYKDFPTMDSLRNRDYTYPVGLPEYEMSISGGADKFLAFIRQELVPVIDTTYKVDKQKRILMGHSLGGYFTLYSLQQQIQSKENQFNGYIAASPSIHYNHYFLLHEFEQPTKTDSTKVKVYTTFGGLEDNESKQDSTIQPIDKVLAALSTTFKSKDYIEFKGTVYSNLDHMDTPLPSFVKGLQWILNN
ncbi:alpha/beta hydrolase [Chitinophaga silvatica]|uniref:Alpha/beta hydrolase n=1 Tax=Chitinophaga silvatica TaxID=2282649 RepID=A0A3E1Y6F0_9BACT|nr:alpha/beta hydrolase-fold protein [Chitinophaga silvatica]RFS20127.1 alpha/beta hydrolase [Chitinophaga silvatica]